MKSYFKRHRIHLTALLIATASLNAAPTEQPLNILFFGNSYTFYNDLPTLVNQVAVADGQVAPLIISDTQGGTNLAYHEGEVTNHAENNIEHPDITGKQWDFVVLQGYSLGATTERDPVAFQQNMLHLFQSIRNHASGNASEATAILYQTWAREPSHGFYPKTFETAEVMHSQITTNYQLAGETINDELGSDSAQVARVGDAFAARGFERSLYSEDVHHPSASGSLLTALVIYQTIYDENVADIDYESVSEWAKVDEATWKNLQATATQIAATTKVATPQQCEHAH